MKWFIVVGRMYGDDQAVAMKVHALESNDAMAIYKAQLTGSMTPMKIPTTLTRSPTNHALILATNLPKTTIAASSFQCCDPMGRSPKIPTRCFHYNPSYHTDVAATDSIKGTKWRWTA